MKSQSIKNKNINIQIYNAIACWKAVHNPFVEGREIKNHKPRKGTEILDPPLFVF